MGQIVQTVQQTVEATPAPVNWLIMGGSLVLSFLQPLAAVVAILWGCLQAHGWIEKRWGHDFLWLNRIFGKRK